MSQTRYDFITIVSGLPRSGTSMMMRMLKGGGIPALMDHVRATDEDNPLGYYEFEPVKRTKSDPSWLENAQGKAVKMVHLLLRELPGGYRYRVIFMHRALGEVVASQNAMLQRRGSARGDLTDDKLIDIFREQTEEVQRWIRAQPNFELLDMSYNHVIADPAPQTRMISDFLDGELDTAAMIAVVDPALYRKRGDAGYGPRVA